MTCLEIVEESEAGTEPEELALRIEDAAPAVALVEELAYQFGRPRCRSAPLFHHPPRCKPRGTARRDVREVLDGSITP